MQVDLQFTGFPALSALPRTVYALLRSPLLSSAAQAHSDLTAYLQHLWTSLPPRELVTAIYPTLSAWADTDTLIAGVWVLHCSVALRCNPGGVRAREGHAAQLDADAMGTRVMLAGCTMVFCILAATTAAAVAAVLH